LADKCPIHDDTPLIFTSAHGVRHCGRVGDNRQVYCVGNATADAARAFGFSNVVSANGDWKDLVKIVESTDQMVVHVSGADVRGAIVETLRQRGINAHRRIVYRTEPAKKWPIDVNQINAVALYSPMASETLMSLPACDVSHLTAYCLSANVAAPLRGMTVRIAASPNERALIACSRAAEA